MVFSWIIMGERSLCWTIFLKKKQNKKKTVPKFSSRCIHNSSANHFKRDQTHLTGRLTKVTVSFCISVSLLSRNASGLSPLLAQWLSLSGEGDEFVQSIILKVQKGKTYRQTCMLNRMIQKIFRFKSCMGTKLKHLLHLPQISLVEAVNS